MSGDKDSLTLAPGLEVFFLKIFAMEWNIVSLMFERECYCFFMVRTKRVLLSSETDEQQSGAL